MRPFSASSSSSRKKITFGSTALQNIRKSFDKFKFQKEQELFSRLQHRIDTEYIKSKVHKNFYKRDTRLSTSYQLVKERKRLISFDNQIKNFEKFQNHNYLYQSVNKNRKEKIEKYKSDYKKKEKREKIIREKELNKKYQLDNGYPYDIIIERLKNIQHDRELKQKQIKNKLDYKNIILKKFRNKIKQKNEKKRKELELILQIRNHRISQLYTEHIQKREKMRKEIEKRNTEIDRFLYEKEKINENKKNIADYYTNKYHMYTNQIDNILYKKNLDNIAIAQISMMACNDPDLAGLTRNVQ